MTISVVIPTRDRSDSIVKTIESVLENDHAAFELIVIDQSHDRRTEWAVRPFAGDGRLRYFHTTAQGVAQNRNDGIRLAVGEWIAMTDDDCQVPSDWLREIAAAFAANPRTGVVIGNVLAAPHDRRTGFIQSYVRREPYLARTIWEKHRIEGIGGNLAVKKNLWETLGGFDEMLGAGTPFCAAEETDFVIRALLRGQAVYETPRVWVTHSGFRTFEQGETLIQGYILGLTAMYAKHFKCANWSVVIPFFHLVWRWAFQKPVVDFEHLPSRWLRLGGFARGMIGGMRTPVNRSKWIFENRCVEEQTS